jgi:nucleotide sugar dehydrogenase
MNYKVLIVGYGVVGQNLARELSALKPDVYDKYTRLDNRKKELVDDPDAPKDEWGGVKMGFKYQKYDLAFICVDTPLTDSKGLDTTEVVNAIKENDAEIYVIKSTVPVGITSLMRIHSGKRLVFSPEYYGNTQHCNNFDYNFTILGGAKDDCLAVQQILQECYDARHVFRITDSTTAELAKLMENAWIATKVSFCNQFYEIAKSHNVDYEELRELFILDPRVNPAHTFVYKDHPYWDSHCLNKDVPHIAYNEADATLLRDVIKFNSDQKEIYQNNRYNE